MAERGSRLTGTKLSLRELSCNATPLPNHLRDSGDAYARVQHDAE